MIIGAATMGTGSHSIYYTRTIGIGSAGIASNGAVVVRGYMDYEAWRSRRARSKSRAFGLFDLLYERNP
jgi:hypothetical protein